MKNHSDFTVHLHREGMLHSFVPGAPIPDWALEHISNPYVLGNATPDPRAAAQALTPRAAQPSSVPERQEPEPQDPDADTAPADGEPSRPRESGIGSGQPVWAEYARSKGIEVSADWKREDIIAACAQAGH